MHKRSINFLNKSDKKPKYFPDEERHLGIKSNRISQRSKHNVNAKTCPIIKLQFK